MHVGVVGVNHKSASLNLREKLAKAYQALFGGSFFSRELPGGVLVSTCNRTELYFSSPDLSDTHTSLLQSLREEVQVEFEHALYSYFGPECFLHLARVTAGLDSAILAETEIQGQIKKEYEATSHHFLPRELHFLFQKALKVGKEIRTQILPHKAEFQFESALYRLAQCTFNQLQNRRFLFVGASEINAKVLRFLANRGQQNLTVCNRSEERMKALTNDGLAEALSWDRLNQWVDYDVVVFGTKYPGHLISEKDCPRDERERLIIDLSVPRNVSPCVAQVSSTYLFNIQQMHRMVDDRRNELGALVNRAEEWVRLAVEQQLHCWARKEQARLTWQQVSA